MGKHAKQFLILFIFLTAFFAGCSTLSFSPANNKSWTPLKNGKVKGSISIGSVYIDRSGDFISLEREIRDLLPLVFSEESYRTVSPSYQSDYSVAVNVREREYQDGWKTKRSISVDVRLWAGDDMEAVPLSASRSLKNGQQSIALSRTLYDMLRKTVKKAVRGLPAKNSSGRE